MEKNYRHSSHTVSQLTVHLIWITKYRYPVLQGSIQVRCRELIKQICVAEEIVIKKGVVSKDHVHIHIEYPPKLSISDIMKAIKGRTSNLIQKEFPELKKRYWGQHFWASGYGAWSTGNITDEMVQAYLEHHKNRDESDKTFILE